ncbi:MAG: indole-3-glycerol-phosphate synthase TrpC, partial [Rhodococcus sp. (in: high G+C Gram-positive bacteria)]
MMFLTSGFCPERTRATMTVLDSILDGVRADVAAREA